MKVDAKVLGCHGAALWLLVACVGCGASQARAESELPAEPPILAPPAPAGLHRAQVVAAVDRGLGALLSRAEVEPVLRQGSFVGFAIVRFDADADLARVGLRPGDVLLAVGGSPVATPDQAQRAFESLRTAPRVVLDVERGGQKRQLVTPILP